MPGTTTFLYRGIVERLRLSYPKVYSDCLIRAFAWIKCLKGIIAYMAMLSQIAVKPYCRYKPVRKRHS